MKLAIDKKDTEGIFCKHNTYMATILYMNWKNFLRPRLAFLSTFKLGVTRWVTNLMG